MKHVIIGNGPAGVVAAEAIRRADRNADIVMIGDEPEPPYSRMAIPYLLVGNIQEKGTWLRKTDGHFASLNIKEVLGR
ncbi:MAG: FAD-dependent oxidoreductase, partial [Aeromonas sobria]